MKEKRGRNSFGATSPKIVSMTRSENSRQSNSSHRRKRQQPQIRPLASPQKGEEGVENPEPASNHHSHSPRGPNNRPNSGNVIPADGKRIEDAKNFHCSPGRRALQYELKRRATMASVVLKSLSILLGIFFIFVGTTKLTPRVSKELYKELRKEYARYAKVFPLAQTLAFKIPSKWYRRSIGALEILCGACLTFIPSKRIKQVANLTLVLMMLFATYNHWMVGDKFERIAPSLVFFFMLTCRLIVEYQIKRKEVQEEQLATEKLNKVDKADTTAQGNNASGKAISSGKEGRSHSGATNRAKKDD